MRRNRLSAQCSTNKYRVRHGELQQQVNGGGDWVVVGEDDTTDTVEQTYQVNHPLFFCRTT